MRSWIALVIAVATAASPCVEAGVLSGECVPSTEPQLEQLSALLAAIAPDGFCSSPDGVSFTPDPRVSVSAISLPSHEGPREIGEPSGERTTVQVSWFPTVIDDAEIAPRPIFAIHSFAPYRKANAVHEAAMGAFHDGVSAPLGKRFGRITVVGPPWRETWRAKNMTGLLDAAAEGIHQAALLFATGGIGAAYQSLKNAEGLWNSPLDVGEGGSEMVEGARTRDFDRALDGYFEACSGVTTALSIAVPLGKGANGLTASRAAAASKTAPRYAPTNFAAGELDKHFLKHANEFGSITRDTYLKGARTLLGRDIGGEIQGAVRPNGDVLRYNSRTNEFAVGRSDGTIRTYFRPKGGMSYWQKQVGP